MQKDLNDLASNENIGGGQQASQENLAESCYSSKFVPNSTGLFYNCLVQILNKFGAAAFSKIFSRHSFIQTASSSSTAYATPIFALPVVALRYLFGTISSVFRNLCKTKSQQIKQLRYFISSSLSKVTYLALILKDLCIILPALPVRHRINQQRNGGLPLNLQRPNSGIIMMLVVLFIPITFFSFKYSQKLFERQKKMLVKADSAFYRKYYPTKVATIIAKAWDSLKTIENQKLDSAYEEAFNSGVWYQSSVLAAAINGIILENGSSNTTNDTSASTTSEPANAPKTSAEKIAYAKKDITIAIENDKIKVTCNKKSAYALPAECNLDLVLAIPSNANAQIAEIGKASANFIKDNFYYTRGVYASVIPYSGKLSLPADRYDGWTEAFPQITLKEPTGEWYQRKLTCYDLYGTKGIVNTPLSTKYNDSGSSNGYSIMYRSNLFGSTNASSLKYKRMNLNPCTSINIQLFDNLGCQTNCTTYTANQPCIMEPVADLSTAYAKCNSLTLPSDAKNTSSFSFAALEWANNMFQNWTSDPKISAVAGGNNGILSSPSKTTSGRKKAIILIANKPDTFTSGEMTYLGLSNDADEKYIDLEWKKPSFLYWDNTLDHNWMLGCYGGGKFIEISYDGSLACSNNGINWNHYDHLSKLGDTGCAAVCYTSEFTFNMDDGKGTFVVLNNNRNGAACSSDGFFIWDENPMPAGQYWRSVCYGVGKFVAIPNSGKVVAYSSNGATWNQTTMPLEQEWGAVCYGNGKFVATARWSNVAVYSTNGINWNKTTMPSEQNWFSLCYGNGKFVALSYDANLGAYSSDGITWKEVNLPQAVDDWGAVCYGGGKFIAIDLCDSKNIIYSNDGINWNKLNVPILSLGEYCGWTTLCYGNGKFVLGNPDGGIAYGEFLIKTNSVGNKALQTALNNGATSGVTTLTTNACNKLKQAYVSDIRIYLIKYRKSAGDYAYLDNCATSTGGKSYDVSDPTALKTTLDTIAADIKSWAGYQEARVVN